MCGIVLSEGRDRYSMKNYLINILVIVFFFGCSSSNDEKDMGVDTMLSDRDLAKTIPSASECEAFRAAKDCY